MSVSVNVKWYDTEAGLKRALKGGLAGLNEIYRERHLAGYERSERMEEWIIAGLFYLDTCGNTMTIIEGAPLGNVKFVITKEQLSKEKYASKHWTAIFKKMPPAFETCPHCLRGWDLGTAHDYKFTYDKEHLHEKCFNLRLIESAKTHMSVALKDAGVVFNSLRAIPNRYNGGSLPWFLLETSKGPLVVGKRKNVFSISWEDGETTFGNGEEIFKDEQVTKWYKGVHAWGTDSLIKYLRILFRSERWLK